MDGFTVTTERIVSAGGGVTTVGEALAKEIVAMHGMLDEIRSGWSSSTAAPRFAVAMQGQLDQATVIKDALLSHGSTLTSSGHEYAKAEALLAETIPGGAA